MKTALMHIVYFAIAIAAFLVGNFLAWLRQHVKKNGFKFKK